MAYGAAAKTTGVRAKQKAETRQKILQAALEAFAERGFEGASVRDIATAAGVNHGLIKYHYEDKDRLWKAAVDFLFQRLEAELAGPKDADEMSPEESVRAWVHRYVKYCARHPEHARIMVQESIRDSDRLKWAVKKHIKRGHQSFREAAESGSPFGSSPEIPQSSMIYILVAAAQTPFMLGSEVKHIYNVNVYDDAFVEQHADAVFELLFGARTAKKTRAPRKTARRS